MGCWREKRSCSSLIAPETLAVCPKKSKSLPTGCLLAALGSVAPKVSSLKTSSVSSSWSPRPSYVSSKSRLGAVVSVSRRFADVPGLTRHPRHHPLRGGRVQQRGPQLVRTQELRDCGRDRAAESRRSQKTTSWRCFCVADNSELNPGGVHEEAA